MSGNKRVLIEQQFLDAETGPEFYIAGTFDSAEEAEAHIPIYAAQRGQVPDTIDFLITSEDEAAKLGAVRAD